MYNFNTTSAVHVHAQPRLCLSLGAKYGGNAVVFCDVCVGDQKSFGVAMRVDVGALKGYFGDFFPSVLTLALWVGLSGGAAHVLRDPARVTEDLIQSTDRLIQTHVRAWGEAPASMNELRLFAKQTSSRYAAFDIWGQRLEYLRLGKVNYTVRSFGADGLQNRPGDPLDPGVFRWGPLEDKGLRYNLSMGASEPRPSVVLFAGADDATGRWHAKIFLDQVSGGKRLLVRDRQESRFYMIAPHDGVEEFFWVPGQEKLIVTATQSARYGDGVYLWDLRRDEFLNLLDVVTEGADLSPTRQERRLHLALSSISAKNAGGDTTVPVVSAFVAESTGAALNPQDFFRSVNRHEFELGPAIKHRIAMTESSTERGFDTMDFLGTGTVTNDGRGNPQQIAWLRLPMGGDWEKAVVKWQEFAAAYGKTQLAPYAVWGLSLFYREAARQAGPDTKNGKILSSYSLELARGLNTMPAAPGYARAIGAWMAAHP